jgi:hypothetical protein
LEQRFATTAQAHKWGGEIIISGDEARAIFDTFDQDPWSGLQLFKEGETEYGVAIRALLPYETTGGSVNDMAHIPSPDTQVLSVTLSCSN